MVLKITLLNGFLKLKRRVSPQGELDAVNKYIYLFFIVKLSNYTLLNQVNSYDLVYDQ